MAGHLSILVAFDRNRLIGADNKLPWHLSADLKRFKAMTTGNAIIMGHRTYESIGRPLPDRQNIVLSRKNDLRIDGCRVANNLDGALRLVEANREAFVIGGAQIYDLAMPRADKLYVTEVDASLAGDTYFPEFDKSQWQETWRESHLADKDNPYDYTFINYEKRS